MPIDGAQPLVTKERPGPAGEGLVIKEALEDLQNQGRIPAHQGRITCGRQLREPLAEVSGIANRAIKMQAAIDVALDEQAVPVGD